MRPLADFGPPRQEQARENQSRSLKKNINAFKPSEGGFYGDKILYKHLNFFDKIFVRIFCHRRFRNGRYGAKILVDEEVFCLRMVSTNLSRLFLGGGDTKFKLPKVGNGDVFSLKAAVNTIAPRSPFLAFCTPKYRPSQT